MPYRNLHQVGICVFVSCFILYVACVRADGAATEKSGSSLTADAGDPTAPLVQMQFTYFYSDNVRNSDDNARIFLIEPVIPVPAGTIGPLPQIVRPIVPFIDVPDGSSGLGDISWDHIFVPRHYDWGTLGYGYIATLPTATHPDSGSGKYLLGPAATGIYYGFRNWQLGALVSQSWSVAGDENRDDVSVTTIQPIINYLHEDWYVGIGDFTWTYNWKDVKGWTIPLGLQLGKIVRWGKYHYNLSVELMWAPVVAGDEPLPESGIKFGFVWLLPE